MVTAAACFGHLAEAFLFDLVNNCSIRDYAAKWYLKHWKSPIISFTQPQCCHHHGGHVKLVSTEK